MTDGRHIWIIDDDDSIRFVLQKALENASMQVTSFNSANNVLEKLQGVSRMPSLPIFACLVWMGLNCSRSSPINTRLCLSLL